MTFAAFNDIASWPLTTGQTVRPFAALTGYDGSSPVGNWNLDIGDAFNGGAGATETFNSWAIIITWQ